MKNLARAILRSIINNLPVQQREYGQAMLVELEETDGLQALVWASGGIQLWAQTRGGEIMKNAAFWFGLVAIGILAGGLYVTNGLIWAVPVVAVGVIAFAAFRPRDAVPVALLLGSSLPVAELLRVWVSIRIVLRSIDGVNISGMFNAITATSDSIDVSVNGLVTLGGATSIKLDHSRIVLDPELSSFLNASSNQLPQLAMSVMIGAILIAGISAFIRSRVAARNIVSQH